jgi:hypothetical protein
MQNPHQKHERPRPKEERGDTEHARSLSSSSHSLPTPVSRKSHLHLLRNAFLEYSIQATTARQRRAQAGADPRPAASLPLVHHCLRRLAVPSLWWPVARPAVVSLLRRWRAVVAVIYAAVHLILSLLLVVGVVGHLRRRRLEALVVRRRRVLRGIELVGHCDVPKRSRFSKRLF